MRSLLENELLSVRLYAARQAEATELEQLAKEHASRLPRVVLWWALARTGFTGEPGPRWLTRRRMVQRRRKLERRECLDSFRKVRHPLACLAHAARLVELHGQDAIPALLEFLPKVARSQEHGEAIAWALGTLGRPILAETLAAARKASELCHEPTTAEAGVRGLGKILGSTFDRQAGDGLLDLLPSYPEIVLAALAPATLEPDQWDRFQAMLPDLPGDLQPVAWQLLASGPGLSEEESWTALASLLHPDVRPPEVERLLHKLLAVTGLHRITPEVAERLHLDDPERRWLLARFLVARGLTGEGLITTYLERPGTLPPTRAWVPGLVQALDCENPEVVLRALDHLDTLRAWEAREAVEKVLSHPDEEVRKAARLLWDRLRR